MADARTKKKKVKKNVPVGIVHIQATFNNTLVTVTDPNGDVLSWSSSGCNGFKGARKSTPFAAQVTAEQAVKKAKEMGVRTISILIKGPGAGRESALRAIAGCGVTVTSIKDITPVPHNGCRARKSRRV